MRALSVLSLFLLLLWSPANWAAEIEQVSKEAGSTQTSEDMGRVSLSEGKKLDS